MSVIGRISLAGTNKEKDMGWLFGHYNRRSLVEHLISGNGLKTIKHCAVGNNLWCVHEFEGKRWACLYLLRGSPRIKDDPCNWGYKDVCEFSGPNEISFPHTWLELLSPTDSKYANEWRARVKTRGRRLQALTIGSRWRGYGHLFKILKRRSPTSFLVEDERGREWKITADQLLKIEKSE